MWYHSLCWEAEDKSRILYATSDDGIHWEKPNLGLVDYKGSKDNNIFIRRSGRDHILSVIHTPWDPDPERQYREINWNSTLDGYYAATSPDGIHWTDVSNNPVSTEGGDVGNFVWDPNTKRYLGYVKRRGFHREMKRRAAALTTSEDFKTWSEPELILVPDDVDDRWGKGMQRSHFYGMCAFPYESMYLAFLWIFQATDDEGYHDGPIFIELVSSRDGINWKREEGDRPPILELGPSGSWDDGMVFTTNHPLVEGETVKLFYGGIDGLHAGPISEWDGGIGLATLRKDGFASLDAGEQVATVTTKKLTGAKGLLHVNCDASGGWLKAEILDASGKVIPGYALDECKPLEADKVSHVMTWKNEMALPDGDIRIRFEMQSALLYSFMAGDGVSVVGE